MAPSAPAITVSPQACQVAYSCVFVPADVAALPQPNSLKVVKKELPGRYVAAIRFAGLPFDWEVTSAEQQLRQALARDGLQAAAGYSLARYNEPFVPPPVRRNEVLIDLVDFEWPMP